MPKIFKLKHSDGLNIDYPIMSDQRAYINECVISGNLNTKLWKGRYVVSFPNSDKWATFSGKLHAPTGIVWLDYVESIM